MTHLDLAALFILIAIPLLAIAALWQLYIMLSETYTLNRYQKQPRQMLWIAISLFFTFSLLPQCPQKRHPVRSARQRRHHLLCAGDVVQKPCLKGSLKYIDVWLCHAPFSTVS